MTHGSGRVERRLFEILDQTVQLPPQEREVRALELAGGDEEVARRVRSVLRSISNQSLDGSLKTGGAERILDELTAPDFVGPYRIIREIGRGGMGTVYLGQKTGEDFEHLVAIKLVSVLDQSAEIASILRWERRTLAKLKHPNIAQMYDGAETDAGVPYLVMEYVSGLPLDEFLAEHGPGADVRFRIFAECCAATSHAHRNLVVHRDLSPRNILVTESGQTKVIDFGIATSLTAENLNPVDGRRPHTKGYSAPERASTSRPATTEDIYSLGCILRFLTDTGGPKRSRDLEAIIDRACASRPEDRYQNIDSLLSDVEAYRTGHSVSAMGAGRTYRLRRFVARNPIGVTLGATVLSATIGAAFVMSYLWSQALVANEKAQKRFDQVREISSFMMFDLHESISDLQGAANVRERLLRKSIAYLDELAGDPAAPMDLKIEVALGYKRLAEIVGNAAYINLGHREDAGALLSRAALLIDNLGAQFPQREEVISADLEVTSATMNYEVLSNGDGDTALILLDEAARLYKSLNSPSADDRMRMGDAYLLASLATLHTAVDQSVDWAREGLEKYKSVSAPDPESQEYTLGIAKANSMLGEALAWQAFAEGENYNEALQHFDESVQGLREMIDAGHDGVRVQSQLLVALLKRANTACYTDEYLSEGIRNVEEARQISESLMTRNEESPYFRKHLSFALRQAADCLVNAGRKAEAVAAIRDAVFQSEILLQLEPSNGSHQFELLNAKLVQMSILDTVGEKDAACTAARETLEVWSAFAAAHPDLKVEEGEGHRADASAYLDTCSE